MFAGLLLLLVSRAASAQTATVTTNKTDYVPGETVVITGSGYLPGETVALTLVESPLIDTHGPYTAVADANGKFVNTSFVPNSADVGVTFTLTATGQTSGRSAQTSFMDASGNLDQGANGRITADLLSIKDPVAWQNGDLNANNSHMIEGFSVPYRLVLTGLTPGSNHAVHIEWDIRQGGLAAIDYI
ncbi:MAG: hypothetical protein DMD82_16965, partial [Candidatus Rokuibacteriota bacterium]